MERYLNLISLCFLGVCMNSCEVGQALEGTPQLEVTAAIEIYEEINNSITDITGTTDTSLAISKDSVILFASPKIGSRALESGEVRQFKFRWNLNDKVKSTSQSYRFRDTTDVLDFKIELILIDALGDTLKDVHFLRFAKEEITDLD